MQPYFLPYIGYFQLISAVDTFVIYDNIQYTKKGWINRNRMLLNGKDELFSISLKKDSDYLNINEREIALSFQKDKGKILGRIQNSYRKSPYFKETFPLIKEIFEYNCTNLFSFVYNAILQLCNSLEIESNIIKSSSLTEKTDVSGEERVIGICNLLQAQEYYNPIGGLELYSERRFEESGINLNFLKSNEILYPQFNNEFVPWLSILDVMMFNSKEEISSFLNNYSLVNPIK